MACCEPFGGPQKIKSQELDGHGCACVCLIPGLDNNIWATADRVSIEIEIKEW